MFQTFFKLWSACSPCNGGDAFFPEPDGTDSVSGSLSFFSLSFTGKSKPEPVPGVLGVLACPKDAKAPVPKPNAGDPPGAILGDFAEAGDELLKGFDLPCDDLGPKVLGESVLPLSRVLRSLVGSEILSLVLCYVSLSSVSTIKPVHTLIFLSIDLLDP